MLLSDKALVLAEAKPTRSSRGIVSPQPFPDELARSVKGRLMRLNGLVCEEATNRLLDLIYRQSNPGDVARRLPIETLAFAVGMDRQSFVCQHTMLPYRRAMANLDWDEPHGSDADPAWCVPAMLQSDRSAAFLCPQCVEEDLSFHGVSFWRREHQLPGRWWCSKHDGGLHLVDGRDPFFTSPASSLQSAKQPHAQFAVDARRNPFVQRFATLQSELIQRRRPLSAKAVHRFLQELCKREKLKYGRSEDGHHLSRALGRAFGSDWLHDVVGTPSQRHARGKPAINLKDLPSCALALASLAVLGGDVEDATRNLILAGSTCPAEQRRAAPRLNGDALRRLYIKHCGVHKRVADEMGLFPSSVKYRLDRMGLPTLSSASIAQLRQDLSAFASVGQSLAGACNGDAARQSALEEALRGTAKNLLLACDDMELVSPSERLQ